MDCSGLEVSDYFAAVRKARDYVQVPEHLNPLSHQIQASAAAPDTTILPPR
jgi:ribonuclease I